MFISQPEHYTRNTTESQRYHAGTAKLTAPDGQLEPAVILKSGKFIKVVLPAQEALRLANEIADTIAAHHNQEADHG